MIRSRGRVEVAAKMYRVWRSSRGMAEDCQRVSDTVEVLVELGSRWCQYISWSLQGVMGEGRVVLDSPDHLDRLDQYVLGVRR